MIPDLLFVTGTDTGVGKTIVASAIISMLRDEGVHVAAIKPVETGVDGQKMSDADILLEAAGGTNTNTSLYRFRQPLAPAVAADIEGIDIDVASITSQIRNMRDSHDAVIIEGAGGVMVPLNWNSSFLDLAHQLSAQVILVARPGLGTINHCLLTVRALQSRQVEVFGIILNGRNPDADLAERTNGDSIRRLTGYDRVAELPRVEGDSARAIIAEIKPHVVETIGKWFFSNT